METYTYSADDDSLLTPVIYKFFIYPLVKIVPLSIPANIITFVSNSFVVCAFLIAYVNYIQKTANFLWLIPVLCFIYLVGDCFDGIQARRTNTGTPLGEYLDHFLDSFVTGLITGIILLCYRIENPILILLFFHLLYIGQIGTFWERLNLGVMKFSKISTSEGIMIASITASLYSLSFIQKLNEQAFLFGFSIPQIIMILCYSGAGLTAFFTFIRTRKMSYKLLLHIVMSLIFSIVITCFVKASLLVCTLLFTFYNVIFIESLLSATNGSKKERMPDLLVPISCVFYYFFRDFWFEIQICQIAYLLIRILIRFVVFFNKYKHCWYWKNPVSRDIDKILEK